MDGIFMTLTGGADRQEFLCL